MKAIIFVVALAVVGCFVGVGIEYAFAEIDGREPSDMRSAIGALSFLWGTLAVRVYQLQDKLSKEPTP